MNAWVDVAPDSPRAAYPTTRSIIPGQTLPFILSVAAVAQEEKEQEKDQE
jgi:hypothetical protein